MSETDYETDAWPHPEPFSSPALQLEGAAAPSALHLLQPSSNTLPPRAGAVASAMASFTFSRG